MTRMIPSLKVGTRVAPANHTQFGEIRKRQGPNRYWVTTVAQGIAFTILMNRNQFTVCPVQPSSCNFYA